jgi:hypothetical protein
LSRVLHRETRPATILRVVLGGSAIAILAVAALLPADPAVRMLVASAAAAELLILFALHSLTIEVREDALELRFGPGWLRRRYAIADIASARLREWRWLQGAGVRVGTRGTIYLVAKGDVVELTLKSGRWICVSALEARKLLRALGDAGVADIGH